ncbi:MAG: helix-turn-helix transcriptional regulator, partial [Boseongicola sp. SB0670_bin_30]|nr:helix-turn-helix transcriptional regulator [Boseongicola sp. SB0670_bin_30]
MPTSTSLESLGSLVSEKRGMVGVRATAAVIGISPATLSRIENGHLPDL